MPINPDVDMDRDWMESVNSLMRRIVRQRILALDDASKGTLDLTPLQLRASELLLKSLINKLIPDKRSLELEIPAPASLVALLMAQSNGPTPATATGQPALPGQSVSISGVVVRSSQSEVLP